MSIKQRFTFLNYHSPLNINETIFLLSLSGKGFITGAILPAIVLAFHESTTGTPGNTIPKATAMVNGKTYPAAIDKQGQFSFNFNKEVQVKEGNIISIN